jgi:hypothetical protein
MGLMRLDRARARMFVPRCVSKSRLVRPTKRRSVGPRHALIVEHARGRAGARARCAEKPSAGEQTQVTVPMPEHEPYPQDHEGSDTVTDEKRERHCGAGETAAC